MRIALLVGPEPLDAEFLEDVLRIAGHEVERMDASVLDLGALASCEAFVASLDVASRLGWLEARAAPALGARIRVVVSRFPRLLAPLAARADLRILVEPSTPAQVLAALDASSARPPPAAFDETFDWGEHDARVAAAGLARVPADAQLGSIASLAARGLDVPIAFVALVTSEQQRFVGEHGLPDDLRIAGGTPREWSFCQHVVASDAPLVVEDAASIPALADTPLVRYGMVRAYAGVPVHAGGAVVGTVCALSSKRRAFTANDVATLELAARAAEARLQSIRTPPPSHDASAPESITIDPSEVASVPPSIRPPPLPAASERDLVGSVVDDKYLVTAQLGEGGMARVYLARDRSIDRLVALKVLDAKIEDALLLREARQLASIRHPCILQLFDWGRLPSGRPYLVLEYLRGESLRDRIHARAKKGAWIPRQTVMRKMRDLAGALETLHGAGLVHGDVKPGNVLVDDALDRVVLIDFGLAMNAADVPGATIGGGTPGYSAPEQLTGVPTAALPTLDVYALGAVAYALLTLVPPFARLSEQLRVPAQREGAFSAPSSLRSDLGPEVDAVFARALAPDPKDRFGTVTSLVDALARALAAHDHARDSSPSSTPGVPTGDPGTRGASIARMRDEVARELGNEKERALVATLGAADAAALDSARRHPGRAVPTLAYSAYLRAYARGDRARIVALAERVARTAVPEQLGGLAIERAPHTVLRAAESLFHRFHDWGTLRFVRERANRSRIELTMPRALAPEQCAAFAGAVSGTVQWVRRDVRVREVACVADGAAACVFEVDWRAT